ncbi:hypothetical protein D3C80_1105600 [compost metagenome]
MLWRAFYRQQRRAAPFSANGKALDGTQRHQQDGCPPAYRGERGQNTNQRGGDAHHPDGEHQHPFTAKFVAKMTEDNAAERPEQEPHAKGRERSERPHGGTYLREKLAIKDQCGGDAVEQKIIPVDDCSGEAAKSRTTGAGKRWCLLAWAIGDEGGIHFKSCLYRFFYY